MEGLRDRPSVEETRPELTWAGQLWRLVACLAISMLAWSQAMEREWLDHRGIFWGEVVLGIAAFVLVIFRRRAPVTIAAILAVMSAFSGLAAGPATLGAVSMATARRPWPIIGIGVLNFCCAMTYTLYAPFVLKEPIWVAVTVNLVVNSAMMGWGMYLGSRRELLWTLHQRALRAESEQELRVARGRSQERERIAREMHDVLAHRITQVSMHAGALAFREDLGADQLREGLETIQGKANEAIRELRGVLGVLRDQTTGALIEAPQPTFDDVAALVEEARGHGVHVDFTDTVDRSGEPLPGAVGRAVYRIVQEGLTNASKHAPGALVTMELGGTPTEGITVGICNPLGFGDDSAHGAGLGLVGLLERAELRGGTLSHGQEGATFVLRASIPWAP